CRRHSCRPHHESRGRRAAGQGGGVMSESLGLTSHKSSCNCTGCGLLRAGVCINCAEKIAALILESSPGELATEPCSGACREAIELYFSTPPGSERSRHRAGLSPVGHRAARSLPRKMACRPAGGGKFHSRLRAVNSRTGRGSPVAAPFNPLLAVTTALCDGATGRGLLWPPCGLTASVGTLKTPACECLRLLSLAFPHPLIAR